MSTGLLAGRIALVTGAGRGIGADEFDHVHGVNVRGTFLALAAEIRAMGPGGAIVNVSSVGSWRGAAGGAAYAAAKRAVNSLTESAAIECGPHGIRVNAVAPGPTRTAMIARWQAEDPAVTDALVARTPLGRFAEPHEVAEAAAWLLSDRAAFVTGAVLPVDGGFRA